MCDQEEDCEKAFFKMDNVLIDDRRIHVDFSQSVSKIKWKGKGESLSPTTLYIIHVMNRIIYGSMRFFSTMKKIWDVYKIRCYSLLTLHCFISMWKSVYSKCGFVWFLGGKYTKDDFKAYEKELDNKSKLALKDKVKSKQEYPLIQLFTFNS